MRALHTGDLHLELLRYSSSSRSRLDDFVATFNRAVDTAIERACDLILLPGDLFHNRYPQPRSINALAEGFERARQEGIVIVGVAGNHDGKDTVGDRSSETLGWLSRLTIPGVYFYTDPVVRVIEDTQSGPVAVVAMPYPHKQALDAEMPDATPEERVVAAGKKMDLIVSHYYEQAVAEIAKHGMQRSEVPVIFVGHLTVAGGRLGAEQGFKSEWDVILRHETLLPFDYAALGHLHYQQQINDKAWYAGAPEYHDFGEIGRPRGFLVVDFEPGTYPSVEVVDSHARPMLRIVAEQFDEEAGLRGWRQTDGDGNPTVGINVNGAIVNFIVKPLRPVPATVTDREIQSWERAIYKAGAFFVKQETQPQQAVIRERARIEASLTPPEALARHLSTNKYPREPYYSAGLAIINGEAE